MARKKDELNVLDMNANMQGSVVFSEDVNLRINGNFSGELKTKGILFVGEKADVNAEIYGDDVTIAGTVKGNINASQRLTLLKSAVIEGDIFTKALEVKEGALFEGRSHMTTESIASASALPEKMNLTEVSKYLDIKTDKIEEWANIGKIPADKKDESWMFEKKDIDQWLKANA